MSKYLVIVESPTKARTITSILGDDYDVTSSMGHIIDLPPNSLSIDVDNGFAPSYRIIPGKEKIIAELKKKAKGKEMIYLATDPDREGEAISWHIQNTLAGKKRKFSRVTFHEITKDAVKEAFTHAQDLDLNKVEAQKSRRVLDRIVGYNLSPLLWKKIVRGLSAGRVQSVALKFIVEREREIEKFIPVTTYEIEAECTFKDEEFSAKLKKFNDKKAIFEKESVAKEAVEFLKNQEYKIYQINKKETKRKPQAPYITSSLQQDAFNKLRFSSKRTMVVAQKLYEGIELKGEMQGLITYMRTDSFKVADKAKKETRNFVNKSFGENYVSQTDYKYKEKKSAQGAHEAIRPTNVENTPARMKDFLGADEHRLYELIWNRFVSCFMREAIIEYSHILVGNKATHFDVEGKKIVFDGFLKILGREDEKFIPDIKKNDPAQIINIQDLEKRTKPPGRFTDASLVKMLEDKGIGRPSTYAPIISTLTLRNYMRREKGHFKPTDLGVKVCDFLVEKFSEIMDENFTALVEEKLDGVEDGKVDREKFLKNFYKPFKEKVDAAAKTVVKLVELVDKICPKCKRQLSIKWSRKGKFLSCSGYPQCKYAESITTGVKCPEPECADGLLIERRNKRGQFFYGCSKFPACTYTSRTLPKKESESEDSGEKIED